MQLLQQEQLAIERKFLYKRSCVPRSRSLSLKKKQKIITPSFPTKKSLDEMLKRNGAVAGIGKKNTNSDQVCTKPDQNSKSKFISSGLSIYNRNFLSSSDEIPATDALVPSALLGHRTLLN